MGGALHTLAADSRDTPEKLAQAAEQISTAMKDGGICVVGGAEQMEGCGLDEIITL